MSSELALNTLGAHGGRWRRYPAYRDSGVGRIGEVPEGWSVKRMDAFTSVSKHPISAELLSGQEVFHYSIPIVQEKGTGQLEDGGDIESNKTLITEQVLLVSKLNPRKGTITLASPQKAITVCSGEFVPLVPRKCVPKYLEYVYCSEYVRQLLSSRVESVTKSHQRVNPIEIYNMFWSWPSLPEQRTIAGFLDRETRRIDTLIEKKGGQIELLQEKRAALISHTVTKGLDPDVKMKDSGVEWVGKIPEVWEVKRLKHVCLLIKDGTHQPPSRTSNGMPLLSVRNIVNGKFVNLPDDSLISEEDFNELQRSFEVKKNDILLAIVGATIGKVAIVEEMLPFAIQRSLAVFRPNTNIAYYKYISYFLQSSTFQQLLWKNVGYSAQPGIYLGSLANFNITVPGMNEQSTIATFLDRENGRIDTLTTKVRESISKLREYRTALISAAVTGKIDVREDLIS